MSGVIHKARRALLTDPHSGARLTGAAIARGAVAIAATVCAIMAALVLSLGLGQ